MRIGLDARLTRQMSVGMKTYARELSARLPCVAPEFEYITFVRGGNFGWSEQVTLPLTLRRSRLDLVHFLSIYTPLMYPAPSIVTVHDLIHLHFPEQFTSKVGFYYQFSVRRACARAARVITDDERTVTDLERFLGVDAKKVRVIPLGVDTHFFDAQPFIAQRPYLLYVGNHRPHKEIDTLLQAWSSLPPQYGVDLYLTGDDDFAGALQRYSRDNRRAIALGDVSSEALAGYYAGAEALVHPALREGFGLPMLEAMAAGTAVIACADAVPGILEPAALTFPGRDARALCERLASVLGDEGLRGRLVNEGRVLARTLTWDRCARATANVYREVLA